MTQQSSSESPGYEELRCETPNSDIVLHPTLVQLLNRLQMAQTVEERLEVFCDMKKTPHLLAAVIKLYYAYKEEIWNPWSELLPETVIVCPTAD